MKRANHPKAQHVQNVLGPSFSVVEFDASTKTSAEAAAAIGCIVGQIAKSIVFKTAQDAKPVLVVASGANRVDDKKVSALLGEKVKSADVDYVRQTTGFEIGGVAPVGHLTKPIVLIDQDLQQFDAIWAAGGAGNAVFKLTWDDLLRLTGGRPADVAKQQV